MGKTAHTATTRIRRAGVEALRKRVAELEAFKSFEDEICKVIRVYSSTASFTVDRCLQEVVNFIQKKYGIYAAVVLRLDETSHELIPLAFAGDEALRPHVKAFRIRVGEGLTGEAAQSGHSVMVHDIRKHSRYVSGPLTGIQSELVVPIKHHDKVIGVLDLEDRARNRFTRELADAMEHVALSLGLLLETRNLRTELKRHQEQMERMLDRKISVLARSEERYRSIVENASFPILTTDVHGAFTWANRAAHELLGYGPGELEGVHVAQVLKKGYARPMYSAIKECAAGFEVRGQKIEIATRRGEDRSAEMSCSPIRDNGRVVGMEMALHDVTDRQVIDKLKKNYLKSLEEAVVARTSEIKDTQRAAILAIANLAESIDDDTGGHIQRIQHYARVLAEELRRLPKYQEEITDEYIELIHDLSPLHDLGKVGIRDYILQKPDKLTGDEFEKMKDHTVIGARALNMAGAMIKRESIFSIAEMIAHFHHEKWDGTGYPAVDIGGEHRPLRGEEIPLCARLVALADVYDALTSKRPYKMPFPHETVREMIVNQSGKHFDPDVVQAFLRREHSFIEIRTRFPETLATPGKPFELPARDRV
ncbi:MAG: PAS domain S-box protein [Planctomycetes bacterium]|nr:PAS domain S-box protein [Planctomycetota bacterium]